MYITNFKFILIGGYIQSIKDNDLHWISPERLQRLYHLPPNKCVFIDEEYPEKFASNKDLEDINPYQIILYPRAFGDYAEHLYESLNRWGKICELN